jgi:hypothetical protein
VLIGAMGVELMARRSGLVWDETGSKTSILARRLAVGFGLGVVAAGAVVLVTAFFGGAKVGWGHPDLLGLGIGLLVPGAQAARDELLFRGASLALMRGKIPDRYALPFTALLGAAPMLLADRLSLLGLAIVIMSGMAFALLWRIGRGMYLAWGAHAGWLFAMGGGIGGGLLDVTFGGAQLFPLTRADGVVGWVALAVAVVAVLVAVARSRR